MLSLFSVILVNHLKEQEIIVTGFWSLHKGVDKTKSKMVMPKDLIESVQVQEVHTENLTGFEEKVMKLVEKDRKVLIIKTCFNDLISKVFECSLKYSYLVHSMSNPNESGAKDWIAERSTKKFLITDGTTVAGFGFDNVLIVAEEGWNDISTFYQRAKAKLIVCYDKNPEVENTTWDSSSAEEENYDNEDIDFRNSRGELDFDNIFPIQLIPPEEVEANREEVEARRLFHSN